jgi:hypothetical protein
MTVMSTGSILQVYKASNPLRVNEILNYDRFTQLRWVSIVKNICLSERQQRCSGNVVLTSILGNDVAYVFLMYSGPAATTMMMNQISGNLVIASAGIDRLDNIITMVNAGTSEYVVENERNLNFCSGLVTLCFPHDLVDFSTICLYHCGLPIC